jgi:4-amino-4-deoxy-L-arabinose transferase-like glycosyltransferase
MKIKLALLFVFFLAFALRLIYFKNSLTFFYDQARDAIISMEIWQNDPIKILGPQTDLKGLHHGPLYWYLISPFYFFSGGNVWLARLALILINCITIFFIFDLTFILFKNKKIALFSAFLFAFSFEAIQYARWLSNPAPAILPITISFWSLYQLIIGKKWAIIPLLTSWAISIQFQFFMIYQGLIFIIIWLLTKWLVIPKTSLKNWILAITGFLFFFSTFIVSEIKFNFQGIKIFFGFLKTQSHFGGSFIKILTDYLDRLVNLFFLNIWGVNLFLAGLMTLTTFYLIISLLKKGVLRNEILFLFLWLISPIVINFFTAPNANFVTLGALIPAIILTAYSLFQISKKKFILIPLLIIIIAGNLNLILTKNKEGEVLFTVQKQMILGDELKIIDWIYKESEGKPFKINTITNPLFINSTWAHLFNWYGQSKYSSMPIWWGENQVNVPGSKIKFADEKETNLHFLIIEPSASPDDNYIKAIKTLEDRRSKTIKSERIGYFTVEKRKIINQFSFSSTDVFWIIKNTDLLELQKVQ